MWSRLRILERATQVAGEPVVETVFIVRNRRGHVAIAVTGLVVGIALGTVPFGGLTAMTAIGLVAGGGLADHDHVGLRLQHRDHPLAQHRVIVGDQHADTLVAGRGRAAGGVLVHFGGVRGPVLAHGTRTVGLFREPRPYTKAAHHYPFGA